MNNKNYPLISVSGSTLLTALFVSLKAFGKIDWSWWFVFSPVWAPIALAAAGLLLIGIVMAFGAMCVALFSR